MKTLWIKTCRCLGIAIPLLMLGCGGGDQPELGTVFGMVTLGGQPLANVEITFAPKVGRPSYGESGADGMYELVYIRDVKGAKIGQHTITVHSTKVDNAKLKPVEIKPGKNLIDIECTRSSSKAKPSRDDDA